ncbi:MAG: nitrilase-related carbon-nitrogen hydrolase [Micromonosporaceae bacterium]
MSRQSEKTPRVALCQFGGSLDQRRNIETAERLARQAVAEGAGLLCFPELANTVYLPFENNPRHFDTAEPVTGPSVTRMRAIARETGTMIVYPIFEREADRYFNTAVVIGPEGDIAGRYRKSSIPTQGLYPDGSERFYFEAGDLPLRVFETPWGFRLGVVICYERNLPEPARCIGLAGADLLLVPVATTDVVRPWWELLLRAHAVFNIFYVGACNKVGMEPGGAPDTPYFGSSLAVDPTGTVLACGSPSDPDVVLFDLDMDLIARQRRRWSFLADRRPDLYGALLSPPSPPSSAPAPVSSTLPGR